MIAAGKKNVLLEITTRAGHSLSNGHVAAMARKHGTGMVVNTDSHTPSDLKNRDSARRIVLGAGLNDADFEQMQKNAAAFL